MMNVVDGGNPDGEATLFIHGFMSSNLQWELNLPSLGRDLRTVLVELPGHGASTAPDAPATTEPIVVLDAIDEIRRHLGIESWWVVGHSFGGAIGLRYALARPERTRGLVFTNSRAAFGIKRPPTATPPPPVSPSETPDLRALPFHPIHAKRFPAGLKDRMVAVADRMDEATIAQVGESARGWRCVEELDQLAVPVMLVNGRWEKAFQANADEAQRLIPGLRRVDLEGGHSINVERSDEFDQAVLGFIADHPPV